MRWRESALDAITENLVRLGLLGECGICGSGTRTVDRRPIIVPVGGFPWRPKEERDQETNVLFLIGVRCGLCGNLQLFDSEQLAPSGDKSLITGAPTLEEEREAEARGELD